MVTPVIFPALGFLGLNKERSLAILGPEWATEAQNVIIDSSGRFAARKGWVNQTTATITGSPALRALHEYVKQDATTSLVTTGGNKLWESSDQGATWTDRTAALTVTADNWQLVNFNDKVIAAQAAHGLLVKTSGNFALIVATSGVLPAAPVAVLAAFGRVWAVESDLQTIKYSALLDETKWSVADGGGSIDMRKVWTQGTDTLTAIRAFGGRLVAFGRRHIVLWVDGKGNALGLDPLDIYVEDVVEGSGTEARDSIQNIGEGDLIYLGKLGVQSLSRVIQEQQTPVTDITKNSRQYFAIRIQNTAVNKTQIKSVYSAEEGFYLLVVPGANLTLCVDLRLPLEDGSYRIFEWPAFIPTSVLSRLNGDVLFGTTGKVGKHSGYSDNGAPYWYVLRTGYLDLGEENGLFKELKRIKIIANAGNADAVIKWWWDFGSSAYSETIAYSPLVASEYGEGEYGVAEYGVGISQRVDSVPGAGSGQYFQLGVEVLIDGQPFGLQVLQAYYETGRLA